MRRLWKVWVMLLATSMAAAGCTSGSPSHTLLPASLAFPVTPALSSAAGLPAAPAAQADDRPLPINLPSALKLANVQAVDIAAAAERVQVAAALLEQAQVLWLPTVTFGGDYNRHD